MCSVVYFMISLFALSATHCGNSAGALFTGAASLVFDEAASLPPAEPAILRDAKPALPGPPQKVNRLAQRKRARDGIVLWVPARVSSYRPFLRDAISAILPIHAAVYSLRQRRVLLQI
jgi:hypothetical protein